MLKDRIAELKAIRDQARADAERAEECDRTAGPSITPQALKTFARQARKRMRTESGGYRRDHLRALAQRVEVDAKEVRIMGSKSELLRTLVAASSAKTAGFGVPSFVPKWRARRDFELLTPRFVVWCSIQLSYGRVPSGRSCTTAADSYSAEPGLARLLAESRCNRDTKGNDRDYWRLPSSAFSDKLRAAAEPTVLAPQGSVISAPRPAVRVVIGRAAPWCGLVYPGGE